MGLPSGRAPGPTKSHLQPLAGAWNPLVVAPSTGCLLPSPYLPTFPEFQAPPPGSLVPHLTSLVSFPGLLHPNPQCPGSGWDFPGRAGQGSVCVCVWRGSQALWGWVGRVGSGQDTVQPEHVGCWDPGETRADV